MRRNQKGFTLVEVLVALLILAVMSVILYQSWNGSLLAVRKGRNYNTVFLLLQKKITEFEIQSKDKKVDELKEKDEGDFGSAYPDYKWEIKMKPFSLPPITPPKQPDGGNSQLAETIFKTMTDYFEKAVREVSVTVIRQVGEKPQKWSVSTIYIDYSQELPSGF